MQMICSNDKGIWTHANATACSEGRAGHTQVNEWVHKPTKPLTRLCLASTHSHRENWQMRRMNGEATDVTNAALVRVYERLDHLVYHILCCHARCTIIHSQPHLCMDVCFVCCVHTFQFHSDVNSCSNVMNLALWNTKTHTTHTNVGQLWRRIPNVAIIHAWISGTNKINSRVELRLHGVVKNILSIKKCEVENWNFLFPSRSLHKTYHFLFSAKPINWGWTIFTAFVSKFDKIWSFDVHINGSIWCPRIYESIHGAQKPYN